jgi:hypothetical protein
MCDRFLEQKIYTECCVKLENNVKIITGDETWFFQYDPESKGHTCNGTADIPMTQDSSHVEITKEDNSRHFLRYQVYYPL